MGERVSHTWTDNEVGLLGYLEGDPIPHENKERGTVAAVFWLVTETQGGVQERHEVSAHKNQAVQVLRGCVAGSRVQVKGRLRDGRVLATVVRFLDGPAERQL